MAYITQANLKRIIYRSSIKEMRLQGKVYKLPIYFFSKYEENALLAIQELLKDPDVYFRDLYIPYEKEYTYTFAREVVAPAYHHSPTCSRLKAHFENYLIPEEIKIKGPGAVEKFRKWFRSIEHLVEDNPKAFEMRWRITMGDVPKPVFRRNTGALEFCNYSIEDLEKEINKLIKAAGKFYYNNQKNTAILRRFSKLTFLAKMNEDINNNNTGYSDKEVKELLRYYDDTFKQPLKNLLIEYYRLKFNPDIKMDGKFLEALGFKECSCCVKHNKDNNSDSINLCTDFLPNTNKSSGLSDNYNNYLNSVA